MEGEKEGRDLWVVSKKVEEGTMWSEGDKLGVHKF